MEQGWIKLHRGIMGKPIWTEATLEHKVILITLLLMANHCEKEWEWQGARYVAKPGQFVTSLKSIVEKSGQGISIQNVRTALARFERYDFLTSQTTNRNRLVTVVNWAVYQGKEEVVSKPTEQLLTNDQQAANKQLTRM